MIERLNPCSEQPFVSICITSYNRPEELKRCLRSIDCAYSDLEIVISEDDSPKQNEVACVVREYASCSDVPIVLNINDSNIGYDRNLEKLFSIASGKYLLLMSDDDLFTQGTLAGFIEQLGVEQSGVVFTPFFCELDQRSMSRFHGEASLHFCFDEDNLALRVYDAILFSGLAFQSKCVSGLSAESFLNTNYFQVHSFLMALRDNGAAYYNIPLVTCGNDGENGYGKSASSGGNSLLADRSSSLSYPEFHKGLITALKLFQEETGVDVLTPFSKEYSLRLYRRMAVARSGGREEFDKFWKAVKELDIDLAPIAYLYRVLLGVAGVKVSDSILALPKRVMLSRRGLIDV